MFLSVLEVKLAVVFTRNSAAKCEGERHCFEFKPKRLKREHEKLTEQPKKHMFLSVLEVKLAVVFTQNSAAKCEGEQHCFDFKPKRLKREHVKLTEQRKKR